jgi:hypothetical protein
MCNILFSYIIMFLKRFLPQRAGNPSSFYICVSPVGAFRSFLKYEMFWPFSKAHVSSHLLVYRFTHFPLNQRTKR